MSDRCFTERFVSAQRARGLTLKDCAKAAEVSEATLHKALNNNGASMTISTLEKLCAVVGLNPAEVWTKPGGST